ncbi:unnamed protein product [Cuscuta campestris]|uniref:Uncharacterized protein n=1 Tax=Cuscuta campestris TaxID=132261 RepID=A0A484N4Y2_9ASTE|nr:unnamed protein product [Cuscuta campestris]
MSLSKSTTKRFLLGDVTNVLASHKVQSSMSTSSTIKYNDVENSVQLQRHNLERNIDLASISCAIDFNEVGQSQVNEIWALAKKCKSTTKRYTSTKKSAQWFKRFVINITAQINNKRKSIGGCHTC